MARWALRQAAMPRLALHRWLLGFVLAALLAACGPAPLYQQESFVFGTRVEILIYGEPEDRARTAAAEVLGEFDRLHRMLHAWEPSELTALNDAIARGERTIPVSAELAAILADAKAIAVASDHLFNPAIGRLVADWGFHSDRFEARLPDESKLAGPIAARPSMADLDISAGQVISRNRAVQLDLGGYAKGYALDRAAALLRGRGITNALINVGGNIMALGSKGNEAWRVGVQHPRASAPLATLALHDGEAIGTSGDYERYFEHYGKRYSHLIDPRTGRPAGGTQAVTVLVTPRPGAGALSDAASKPLFLAGQAWPDYARRLNVAHVLRMDDQGRIFASRPMQARLAFVGDTPAVSVVE